MSEQPELEMTDPAPFRRGHTMPVAEMNTLSILCSNELSGQFPKHHRWSWDVFSAARQMEMCRGAPHNGASSSFKLVLSCAIKLSTVDQGQEERVTSALPHSLAGASSLVSLRRNLNRYRAGMEEDSKNEERKTTRMEGRRMLCS